MKKIGFLMIIFWVFARSLQAGCPLLPVRQSGQWGFIDCNGKVRIGFQFELVSDFKKGFSVVKQNGLSGVIDTTGTFILHAGFESVQILNSGYFIIKNSNLALASPKGEILSGFEYSNIIQINHRSFLFQETSAQYRLFHVPTRTFSESTWTNVTEINSSGFLQIMSEGRVGVVDSLHRLVIAPVLDGKFDKYGEYIVYEKEGTHSFYNSRGELLSGRQTWRNFSFVDADFVKVYNIPNDISLLSLKKRKYLLEHKYSDFQILSDEFIAVKNKKGFGLADSSGVILHDNVFDAIGSFSDNFFIVKKGNLLGLIDKNGKAIMPVQCDFIDPFNTFRLSVFSKNNLLGLLRKDGKILQTAKYDDIETEDRTLKCYHGNKLDVFVFDESGGLEEKLEYHNVHRISFQRRYQSVLYPYFSEIEYQPEKARGIIGPSVVISGRVYELFFKEHTYPKGTKIKTLIPGNLGDVQRLVGLRTKEDKRIIASSDYWDIDLDEIEAYGITRVILPGGRHGLIDAQGKLTTQYSMRQAGRIVNKTISYIGPFRDGLARVCLGGDYDKGIDIVDHRSTMTSYNLKIKNGNWGYFNTRGEMVIEPKFEYTSDFRNGKAIVCVGQKYGVIDTEGKYLIEPAYGFISWMPHSDFQFLQLKESKKQEGLIDKSGNVLIKPKFDKVGEVGQGLVSVRSNGLWGYCDLKGQYVISPAFHTAAIFSEGLAAVRYNNLWGYIDQTGAFVIQPQFYSAGNFRNGLAPVKDKSGYRYIDSQGHVKTKGSFSRAMEYDRERAHVKVNKKWGVINTEGNYVLRPRYKKIRESGPLIIARKGKKDQLFDEAGKRLNPGSFDHVGRFSEGLIAVTKKGYAGFMDSSGRIVIPLKYRFSGDFHEGLARVYAKGGIGFITRSDSLQIPHTYRHCGDFSEGLAVCQIRGYATIIDQKGNRVFTPKKEQGINSYSDGFLALGKKYYSKEGKIVYESHELSSFQDGVALVKQKEQLSGSDEKVVKNVLLNQNLTPLAKYSKIERQFQNYFKIRTDFSYGLADLNGTILLPCEFQEIDNIGNDLFRASRYGETGYIRKDGTWIWQPEQ